MVIFILVKSFGNGISNIMLFITFTSLVIMG